MKLPALEEQMANRNRNFLLLHFERQLNPSNSTTSLDASILNSQELRSFYI